MFGALTEYLDRFQKLDQNKILRRILDDSTVKEIIIDINLAQLNDGIDSKGKSLGELSPVSVEIKKEEGKFIDTKIRLRHDGVFWDSFIIKPVSDGFIIDADTQKETTDLEEEFGEDIFGIEISLEKFKELIVPLIINAVKNIQAA